MLVCLSSGARPRYLEDIIRSLALPVGSFLQFRYTHGLTSEEVQEKVHANSLEGAEICIAYLFSTVPGRPTEIVPCRMGIVHEARSLGSSAILRFSLQGFAIGDHQQFKEELEKQGCPVPNWRNTPSGPEISKNARYCFSCQRDRISLDTSFDILKFEDIAMRLSQFPDFEGNSTDKGAMPRVFYHVLRVGEYSRVPDSESIRDNEMPADGYKFKSGELYSARVYHFFPDPGVYRHDAVNYLHVSTSGSSLDFVDETMLKIDSDYDVKEVKFKTKVTSTVLHGHLNISMINEEYKDHILSDVNLPFSIEGNRMYIMLSIAAISLGVAMPGLIGLFASGRGNLLAAVFMVLFGLLAGFASVFGYRRAP